MLSNPANKTAAAAVEPTGTPIARPSTSTRIVGAPVSGRGRNIEASGAERREHRVQLAGCDHRREDIGMRPGKRDAAVAVRGKRARATHRLIIDRQTVRRHYTQRRPGPDNL